ncbi:M3 family oligoendopeptidase [Curvivirga aplysinae]|uniref:M3 family oligoendopeptidase n=1 Tax=Curvivirga aplysinae TaxID=2529852 RepID=UPI0012BC04E5|nr:M3 family oligoendopeptidase [Curvivirga aplysinae]MTI10811.1 M3 family oligoendopeptidase [Curvivirga aplysinae]
MADVAMDLPNWDLTDLYPAPDSNVFKDDMEKSQILAESFAQEYRGKIADLDGDALATAIVAYEELDEKLSRLMSYAYLVYAGDMGDADVTRFFQDAQERITAISTIVLFFSLELNLIEEEALGKSISDSEKLSHYQPWLRDVRAFREHQLPEDQERILHEKSLTGRSAWVRLFDETLASLKFPFQGEEVTNAEILHKMSDPREEIRKEAAESLGTVFGNNISLFSHITNTLAKDKAMEDEWRGFERPVSSRNLSNYVEDEVVDALVAAVKESYPSLSHRYYKLKAKWLGVDKLNFWDRMAPLPEEDDREIPWTEARDTVLQAYGRFSDDLADIGQVFFDKNWIDAEVRAGKAPGAFAHPTVPSAHPYLLVNYQGKTRDVMTLAHELGHGVHQVLAGGQGHLMADTPLTLAETASVFGEMLTFQSMLANEDDPKLKKAMLASKVEDMLNTVVRQIAFFDFEQRVHDARKNGELSAEEICDIWMAVSEESLGDAFIFGEAYRNYWAYIPHFIHSPFYVYAYAFGDCLVNSLYALYEQAESGFAEKYLDMLRAGGSLRHKELLAPFGLDASDPEFWKKGLSMLSNFIDQLEAME